MSNLLTSRPIALLLAGCSTFASASAQVTQRVSVDASGYEGNNYSDLPNPVDRVVSADGRYVAFWSAANGFVVPDMNSNWDVFLKDRLLGTIAMMTVDSAGVQGNLGGGFFGISMTPDANSVAFESISTNLVPGDTNGAGDVFVHDRSSGATELLSVTAGGSPGDSTSTYPSLSADARYASFTSLADDLVAGDTNGVADIFVRDRVSGTTQRASVSTGGAEANGASDFSSLSADGRYVAFRSAASNLVLGDTNGVADLFVRDLQTGNTERVGVTTAGTEGNGDAGTCSISADGRYVAFSSLASNLVPADTNNAEDVFLRDRQLGATELVSVVLSGGANASTLPSLSSDGRFVAFRSQGLNLVPGDVIGTHVYLRDRLTGTTERDSLPTSGVFTLHDDSGTPSISAGGRYVAFRSYARNLVPGDGNGSDDVFIHDREASGFTSLCSPGVDGILACPCSNPPSARGRGCDNSSGTGGAVLSASGNAYVSIDSLVFTTSSEKPTALSILTGWIAESPSGAVFGMGVRCTSGTFVRLYTKSAVGGSITAPDFAAGDPTVTARSAALGAPVPPGASRFYFVYYRDSTVLGGCPADGTFNATQTGKVTWWP